MIEDSALGLVQNCRDIPVCMQKGKVQCAIIFLRPLYHDDCSFFTIIMGDAKWRRDVTVVNVASCCSESSAVLRMSCNCVNGDEADSCVHRTMLINNSHIRLKLQSITSRKVNHVSGNRGIDSWSALKVPQIKGDDFDLYHVFRRRHLDLINAATASVSLDCRKQRMRHGLKSRLDCKLCRGRAAVNVGLCNHEEAVLNEIVSNEESNSSIMNHVTREEADENIYDSSSSDSDVVENESCNMEPDYQSNLKRNIFP